MDRSDHSDRARLLEACRSLPLFPLLGVVLLPGSLLPLHVFEPRYRQLVADCLRDKRPLSVCQVLPEDAADTTGSPRILPYAGVGIIGAHQELPDGRYNVLVQPVGRVRILSESPSGLLYRIANAELLDDIVVDPVELAVEGDRVRSLFTPLVGRMGEVGEGVARALRSLPPERVPEAVASVVLRTDDARQRFLAEDNPLHRAALVEEAVLTLLAEVSGAVAAEA
ncbi:MAG: LON peptidase substrate-binding domain-containing protein [Pseudomonadota bacterium]|nr:LON peptidase substrate-binding domain-containing protein [Pseudomonadota bacterium]